MSALVRARGQIMFLLGLIAASAIVLWLNGLESVPVSDIEPASALVYTPPAQLRTSWAWFEQNTDDQSGLLKSSASPAADAGHLLRATIAAHRLGLINGRELYERVHRTIDAIDTGTPSGEIGPLVSALELIAWSYPANSGEALKLLDELRATPATRAAVTRPSVAARHADVLVRAAIQRRGDK